MGIHRMTLTTKTDAEVAIWYEGMARSAFDPFRMTRSAFVAGALAYVRNECLAGRLDVRTIASQGLNRLNRVPGVPGIPDEAPLPGPRRAVPVKPQRAACA